MEESKEKTQTKKKNIVLPIILGVTLLVLIIAGLVMLRAKSLSDKLSAGDAYLEEEDYDSAITAYQDAIGLYKKSADAYLGLAEAYIAKGELEEAMDIIDRGIEATGSENLEQSKENVYDQVFASYVMNFYSLNLLAGESEQLTITPKGKDFGFSVEFSSDDPEIASVSADGLVEALKDGETSIIAHIGNEDWGYRDEECLLTVGVVETYLEKEGCDYTAQSVYKAPAYVFQADSEGDPLEDGQLEVIQPEASYRITDCKVSDPDAEGFITYTTTVEVDLDTEFGIVEGTPECTKQWYYDWNVRDMFYADEYTGTVFLEQDLFGSEYPTIDSQLEFNGSTYHITGEIKDEWVNDEEWETTYDAEKSTTYAKAPVVGTFTYTITVPREYAGMVLVFDKRGQNEYVGTEDSTIETDTGFFDTQEDGSVRQASDYYIIRLADIAEHE